METPIEVLRVEQSVISKELSRFRACDPETRSLYCREWAQYIHKKHFVYNAKTQDELAVPELSSLTAGKYQINFIDQETAEEAPFKKERSTIMSKKFEELVESWSVQPPQPDEESLIGQIAAACELWITLPSGYSGLPALFEPVEFNPFPDAIPLVEDTKDPSQLLDPLIIERSALCLPSDCFHLLKNLTGDILLSHTTPTCHHSRPESKQPSDLEVDRIIFNDHVDVAVKKALAELTSALEQAWYPFTNFLVQLKQFESRRSQLMGKGCQEVIDKWFKNQNYVSLLDFWATEQAQFKNKKSTPEAIQQVDDILINHLNHLKSLVQQFLDEFVPNHLKEIHVLTTDLWKLIVPTIYEMGERMASHEDHKGNKNTNAVRIGESLKALDMDSLKKMESSKEVDAAQKRIVTSLTAKVEDYLKEIDAFIKLYKESARPSLSGRIEKLNNKDFKKKLKKLESGYYSIRQTFRYEVTENIFPESLLCKFSLVCLEPLMQEGEVMEALTIEKEVKRFIESHKDLLQRRCTLLHDFEEGVQTGRRELAGVMGKLFLKEGMRIQGDNLALKRQNSLLKSMGVQEEVKKKTKTKKKAGTASSSGAVTPVSGSSSPIAEKKTLETKKAGTKVDAKKIESSISTKKAELPTKKDEPAITKKAEPTSVKKAEPVPVPVKKVEPTPAKKVEPILSKKAESTPVKKVELPSDKKFQPTLAKKTDPVPIKKIDQASAKKVQSLLTTSNVNKQPKQEEVLDDDTEIQDWESLRAEVLKEKSVTDVKEPAVGWSTIAAKVPPPPQVQEQAWQAPVAPAPASPKEDKNDGWSAPIESTPNNWSSVASGWNTETEKPKKKSSTKEVWDQNVSDLGGWNDAPKQETGNVPDGWGKPEETTSGWNDAPKQETGSVPDGWGKPEETTSGWGKPEETTNGWGKSEEPTSGWGEPKNEIKSSGWGDVNKDIKSSGWGDNKKEFRTPGWGDSKKEFRTPGWGDNKKDTRSTGWGDNKKDTRSTGWGDSKKDSRSNGWGEPVKENKEPTWAAPSKKKEVIEDSAIKEETRGGWGSSPKEIKKSDLDVGGNWNASGWSDEKPPVEKSVIPPGISMPSAEKPSAPPGMTMPPGMVPPPTVKKVAAPPPGLNTETVSEPVKSSLPFNVSQFQEPLPADINQMSPEMILMIAKSLHRENGTLIQSVYSLQQEMNMMTNRYTEIMALAREREAQTLALFETRKQTEMEEVRRYVLSLEAKISQLEEQLKNNALTKSTTAGFGNQDLFAGYREEMSSTGNQPQQQHKNYSHSRKLWQKNNANNNIRCGNCGEGGHSSADCKSFCRYCGSLEHLSELCPMN